MSAARVYLDHNATAPLRPEALAAMQAALAFPGNPSSVHASGRAARARVEDARAAVARMVGGSVEGLVFTGGGTEANALAIWSAVASGEVPRLIVGATEHEAVANTARASGLPVEVWPVDRQGRADLDWLADRLARWGAADGRPFAALMLANNETGVIQPVAKAAALLRKAGGWLHVDGVQAAGKIALDVVALGADTLAVSAHKFGGPQGAGALAYSDRLKIAPRQHGGGQERGLRAGTESVAAIAGFGAAADAALRDLERSSSEPNTRSSRRMPGPRSQDSTPGAGRDPTLEAAPYDLGPGIRRDERSEVSSREDDLPSLGDQAIWRDAAAARLKAAGAVIVGEDAPRLPGTLCLATASFPSALQVMALDLAGVEVSAGAACSSGKVKPSGVLAAMGYDADLASGALRASGGWNTTNEDWARFADAWLAALARRAPAVRAREYA
jgi:cysteine desulfurase